MWELHSAAKRNCFEEVKYLVESGANVNGQDLNNKTALHYATESASEGIVTFLVESGADLNKRDNDGKTALYYAVKTGIVSLVGLLVEHGANVNRQNFSNSETALNLAVRSGSIEIDKYLVDHVSEMDDFDIWRNDALYLAVESVSIEIVKYLVEHGAEVNNIDIVGDNALYVAVQSGSIEIVKYLVEHGADVNDKKLFEPVLHLAVRSKSIEIVKYLVEHGAEVNSIGILGHDALNWAVKSGSIEIVKYLVERGADVNRKNGQETALHVAVSCGSMELVEYLVWNGAEVTSVDNNIFGSVLFRACERKENIIVDYLLQHGAEKDIHKYGNKLHSPLFNACMKGHTKIVQKLLEMNVDIRQEKQLICGNEDVMGILKQELKKSIKHREKIKTLKSIANPSLTKMRSPLKFFAANSTFLIGFGSMSTCVYVGILENDSEVAVKRMLIQTSEDAKRVAQNEKRTVDLMKGKTSPFVVNYHHCLMDNTFMYLVFDLCEENLKEYVNSQAIEHLRQHGRRMIKEILTGLQFLHDKGILHRDLKPPNILVDVDGHMRLTDFGISRVLNEDETTFYTQASGTEGWMAVEAIEALNQDEKGCYKKKSDVQVSGMIAFYILTKGEHPFGPRLERMSNIDKGEPVNLKKLNDPDARSFVSWLISHKIVTRPYVHEALNHPFIMNVEYSQSPRNPKLILKEATNC